MKNFILLITILFAFLISNCQPVNNNCTNATPITWNGGCVTGNTTSATTEAGETLTCLAGNQTVWYSFVAENDTVSIKTSGFTSDGCVIRYTVYGPNPTCQPSGG